MNTLLQPPTQTTGRYTHKRYKCSDCGFVSLYGTNHFGPFYDRCSKCSWKSPQNPIKTFVCVDKQPINAFEVREGLGIIARQKNGSTLQSIAFIKKHLYKVGKVLRIVLLHSEEPFINLVYIIGHNGTIVTNGGFTWGFSGEGPRGLQWLFDKLQWNVDPKSLPNAADERAFVIPAPVTTAQVYE